MEKLKSIINSKFLKNSIFWVILIITIVFLGNMVKLEYSRCTFRMYTNPYMLEYEHYLVIGRYIVAIFWKLVNILGLSLSQTYFISYVLGIVSMTLTIYTLYNMLSKFIKNKFLNVLVATGVILNCFLIDYFIYIEKGIFTLSILLTVLAVKFLVKFFETNKKRNLVYSFLLLCLSAFSYQGTVALFVAIATIFIFKYSNNIKKFIYNNVITASIYGLTMGISYLLVRLVGEQSTSRTSGQLYILESIKKVIKGMYNICKDSYGIMPKYLFALTFILVFCLVTFAIFKYKNNKKNGEVTKSKEVIFLGYIYILAACVITSILPQLVIDTLAIDLSARALYPFASIIALSIVYLFVNLDFECKWINKLFIGILLVFLSIQCYEYNRIIIDHYTLNYVEKNLALSIGEEIKKYEDENDIKISKVVFYKDADSKYSYADLKSYGDINERVFRTTWCRMDILNYYLDRDFTQSFTQNEEYKKEFESVDYTQFNDKQLIFEDDTLHLCIY